MADLKYYKLSMPAADVDAALGTALELHGTTGIVRADGKGGVESATPGTDYGYPIIHGNNPPTANTAASLGQLYFDMMAKAEPYVYVCVGFNSYGFVWCVLGGEVIDNSGGGDNSTDNAAGVVPPHGSTGQILGKLSDADYDTGWIDPPEKTVRTEDIDNGAVTGPKIANGAVGLSKLADDTKAVAFTVDLPATGWGDNAQTVSNDNFKATGYAYVVSPAAASRAAYGEAGVYAEDVIADGSMVFRCEDVPETDLTVNVLGVISV